MNRKLTSTLIFIGCLCIWFPSQAQDTKTSTSETSFEIGIQAAYIVAGDLKSIYETTLGLDAQYYFKHNTRFNHFINTGFITDIGTTGANYFGFYTGIGTQYHITQLWQKSLYTEISAGALYSHEAFSTQFIDATINSTNSEFGFKAQLGIGYRITKHINTKIQASQWSNLGISLGLSISYSF